VLAITTLRDGIALIELWHTSRARDQSETNVDRGSWTSKHRFKRAFKQDWTYPQ